MKSLGSRAKSYLRSGILLHLVALVFVLLFISFLPILEIHSITLSWVSMARVALSLFLLSASILAECDAWSRFQNYKQVKDDLFHYGYRERILKPMIKSRCQRDAAYVAADELGMGAACKLYFRNKGYHWFHILPDFVLRNPVYLLSRHFWKTTFFMPPYHSKFDFYPKSNHAANVAPV